jgi:hypothetical protein
MKIFSFSLVGDSVVKSLKTRPECIRKLADTDSAIDCGTNSNLGKRYAYELLAIQQRSTYENVCNVSFFSLLTSYTISIDKLKNKTNLTCPPLLVLDKWGIITKSTGTAKFQINGTIYTRLRKETVVNLCPYVPINHCDEGSCYSNILMHLPWPSDGEVNLIPVGMNSIQYYAFVLGNGLFPEYVKYALEKYQHSDIIRKNTGTICNIAQIAENDNLESDTESDLINCTIRPNNA